MSKPFYAQGYVPYKKDINIEDKEFHQKEMFTNPCLIYDYFKNNVYKQDEYLRAASMLLFNHVKGITSRMIVCGPPGNGKTLVAECIKNLWPNTIIVNSATLTKDGWSGDNKVTSFLNQVDPDEQNCIVVFDEFDKAITSHTTSHGENVGELIQSEFLKLVEGQTVSIVTKEGKLTYDTSKMSFIFTGSFAVKAKDIADNNSTKIFGFNSEEHTEKAFDKELSIDDFIDFGLIPELASRLTDVINVRPLSLKDFEYLIMEHPASPVKKLEQQFGVELKLTKKKLKEIAKDAYDSGLGVRNATARLRNVINDKIFREYENNKCMPESIKIQ